MDRVPALEDDDVGVGRQRGTDLCGGLAGEHTLGEVKTPELATQVARATLPGNHLDPGVLEGAGLVALKGLLDLRGGRMRGMDEGSREDGKYSPIGSP